MVSDRTSALLGAPAAHWKGSEQTQMKEILACYRKALVEVDDDANEQAAEDLMGLAQSETFVTMLGGDATKAGTVFSALGRTGERATSNDGKAVAEDGKDGQGETAAGTVPGSESFLPGDSVLRSEGGEGKAPRNCPFRDYESFVASTNVAHWKDHFQGQSSDRMLSEIAQSTVSHICMAQASGELRVRHGSVPLGKVLRKKREHLTPLALCLHELKLWCTHWLRTASLSEAGTYRELERRIKYLELLQRKEVWGESKVLLQSGMRAIAHDKLFRLLLTAQEDLGRARDYAYRGFTRRASREKLHKLGNLLKDVLLNEMRVVSGLFAMGKKLSEPGARSLQPTDLLSEWKNQSFVDYTNLANVLLRELVAVPLVRASLLSNYESEEVRGTLLDIGRWSEHNMFCVPGKNPGGKPTRLFDESKESEGLLPELYASSATRISEALAEADPHQTKPLSVKQHRKQLVKAFAEEDIVHDMMGRLLTCLATLQDLAPSIYICFELWELAGQGGDFVVYDMLRQECVDIMKDAIGRVQRAQQATRELVGLFSTLSQAYEAAAERKRLLSKKSAYQPAWVANLAYIKQEFLPVSRKSFTQTYVQLWEVARDAWEYNLSAEQLNGRVDNLRNLCQRMLGDSAEFTGKQGSRPPRGHLTASQLVESAVSGSNWLGLTPSPTVVKVDYKRASISSGGSGDSGSSSSSLEHKTRSSPAHSNMNPQEEQLPPATVSRTASFTSLFKRVSFNRFGDRLVGSEALDS